MDAITTDAEPRIRIASGEDRVRVRFSGDWCLLNARSAEDAISEAELPATNRTEFDLSSIGRLDTAGSWLIHRLRAGLEFEGKRVEIVGCDAEMDFLLKEVEAHLPPPPQQPPRRFWLAQLLEAIGRGAFGIWRDGVALTSILGSFVVSLSGCIGRLSRLRGVSILANFDQTCRGAVPIVILMSFIVGLIIAQQGGLYLRQFGADIYVVDLVGVLVLRELGVLLTAILVAGRSGSAFTAEIGSMRMREEVDALNVMGLDPVDVLVVPRLIALMLALPALTFLANIAALAGGGLIVWSYLGIPPETFIRRLQESVTMEEFLVGMIKAPVMALIIGLIACIEGLKVEGSAESLGRQTTTSVVKAIFLVIVVDGLFAIYFAAIDF